MEIAKKYLKRTSGIYCIENILNNKKYVGSSVDFYYRWHRHRSDLIRNKHGNRKLQNSWNKNNPEDFIVYILEECEELDLTKREQFWIDKLNPKFNITLLVERNILSQESRELISKTLKEGYESGRIKSRSFVEIDAYDLKGNLIGSFNSCKDCYSFFNVSESMLTSVLKYKSKQAKGFVFRYKGEKFSYEKTAKPGRITLLECNEYNKEFVSMTEAAKYLGTTVNSLSRCYRYNGKYKKYKIIKK